ncbi:hypothetical protein Hjap01_00664 [Haloarcula japonica]
MNADSYCLLSYQNTGKSQTAIGLCVPHRNCPSVLGGRRVPCLLSQAGVLFPWLATYVL